MHIFGVHNYVRYGLSHIGESGVSWVTFFQMALTSLIFKIESRVRHHQKRQDVKFNFIGEIYFCVV